MKKIDREEMKKLARIQCSIPEFCCAFNCSEIVIRQRVREYFDMTFGEFIAHHGAGGHTSLRRAMWTKALKGDSKMQIFLAQNHLGMSEKIDGRHEHVLPKFVKIKDDIALRMKKKAGDDEKKTEKPAKKKPKSKPKPKRKARSGSGSKPRN